LVIIVLAQVQMAIGVNALPVSLGPTGPEDGDADDQARGRVPGQKEHECGTGEE
jgi:hypothetical protein